MSDFIEVPVTIGFDYQNVVGSLKVLESALPPGVDWCFSLGYLVKDAEISKEAPNKLDIKDYELKCVSIVPDAQYPGVKGM